MAPSFKKQLGVNRLRSLHPDFDAYGSSAMGKDVDSRVRSGRPFGGTGFLYNKKFSRSIRPLIDYKHDRVTVMKLSSNIGEIILINAYLPFLNRKDLQNYRMMYQETVSFISGVMRDYVGCHIILLSDLNCNIYDLSHPYTAFVRDLMRDHSLVSIFDLMPNFDADVDYTRCDLKTGSYSLIDGVLLSNSVTGYISNVCIAEYGDNVSDHKPIEFDLDITLDEISMEKSVPRPFINWKKLKADDIEAFRAKMAGNLDMIEIPFSSLLHGDKCCSNTTHANQIQTYFDSIVDAVTSSDSILPRFNPAIHKPYWTREISELKRKSIACCNEWKAQGRPSVGDIYLCKKRCSLAYKKAVKLAQKEHNAKVNSDLHDHLTSLNNDAFWKLWRNQNKERDSLVTRVDGETCEKNIACAFQTHFQRVYSNNETPAHLSLRNEFYEKFSTYYRSHVHDSIAPYFLSWDDMVEVMRKVDVNKSSSGSVRPEHVLYGSEKLTLHLHLLFNSMIQHGIVVEDFLNGTITPIIKDTQGDASDSGNYRGITLCGLFSKLFEIAINGKLNQYLMSDHLQIGFKKRTSTSNALFMLKSTVDYFTARNSNVYVAFLDCTKAFDRISHYGLFIKLMDRHVPLPLLLLIIFWHLNMSCRVKWGNAFTDKFRVPLGTKQGGVSSPGFFSLYVDDLIKRLRTSGYGCHILNVYLGCIFFADDITLISPTRSGLQRMIDVCTDYCNTFCLQFNSKKSKCIIFGKGLNDAHAPLFINGVSVEYVKEWRYLGTTIVGNKTLSFSARQDLASFFRAANAVINVLNNAEPHVLVSLLYSNCVPILTYACAGKEFSAADMSDCNLAINNVFRKIFGFREWQSIRYIRQYFEMKSIYELFHVAKDKFRTQGQYHNNPIFRHCLSLN